MAIYLKLSNFFKLSTYLISVFSYFISYVRITQRLCLLYAKLKFWFVNYKPITLYKQLEPFLNFIKHTYKVNFTFLYKVLLLVHCTV